MQPEWAQPFIIAYFIAWAGLGIGSWWIIRTRPDAKSKTRWFRHSMIALGILVIGASIPFAYFPRNPQSVPLGGDEHPLSPAFFYVTYVSGVVLICWFTVATTYFCPSCGGRSGNRNLFAKTYHCPHCGHRLKPVSPSDEANGPLPK